MRSSAFYPRSIDSLVLLPLASSGYFFPIPSFPMDVCQHKNRLILLPSIYGVVERIHGILMSDVFLEIKSQSSSLLQESDLRELHTTLTNLRELFTSGLRQGHLEDVKLDLEGLARDAYDVEDVLDLAATQDLMMKVEGKRDLPPSEQILMSTHVDALRGMLTNIRHLLQVLADGLKTYERERRVAVADDKMFTFPWEEKVPTPPPPPGFMQHSTTERIVESSREVEDFIVGRNSEKKKIITSIFSPSNQEHPKMISVYGEAGIGKTTLVKLVCNDVRVSAHFDAIIWVPIRMATSWGFGFDIESIIFEIMLSASPQSVFQPLKMDIELLQRDLCGILEGQRYLLVLDGFEMIGITRWNKFKEILKIGSTGSTVILINTSRRIPSFYNNMPEFHILGLPEEESWSLFARCTAFDKMDDEKYFFLKEVGRSIVGKCDGNPRAIKTLGSTFVTNRYHEDTWRMYVNRILKGSSVISVALSFGIENMPYDLIQCFLASAILFENKVVVCKDQLLYFWMAHGLLSSSKGNKDPIDIADTYCNELLLRGFLQLDRSEYHPNAFQMHIEARHIAKSMLEMSRYTLWSGDEISTLPFQNLCKTRTLLFKHYIQCPLGTNSLEGLISNVCLARVLLLDHSDFEELPDAIGNLKLLRYLSLEGNRKLQVLPESICNLVNLHTLNLSGCVQLKTLPRDMHKLVSLRDLLLSVILTSFPDEAIKSWTSLHLLKICYCQNLNSLSEGTENLASLRVLWIHDCLSISSLPSSMKNLASLKELIILDCQSLDLTGWDGLLTYLQVLELQGLPKLTHFPVGFQSAAGSLQRLAVINCENLKALPKCLRDFTNLLELVIDRCLNLDSLPEGIDAFQTMQSLKIFNSSELIARCEGRDWERISHIPKIQLLLHRPASTLMKNRGEPSTSSTPFDIDNDVQEVEEGGRSSTYRPQPWRPWLTSQIQWLKVSERRFRKALVTCCWLVMCLLYLDLIPHLGSQDRLVWFIFCIWLLGYQIWIVAVHLGLRSQVLPIPGSTFFSAFNFSLPCRQVREGLQHSLEVYRHGIQMLKAKPLGLCHAQGILFLLSGSYEFEKDMLIQLWMAGGFIKDEPMEKDGAEDFDKLLSQGYILRSDSETRYKVNTEKLNSELEMIREKSSFLRLESMSISNVASTKTVHVAVVGDEINDLLFETLRRLNKLRTLLFIGDFGSKLQKVPWDIFLCYESLEALDLSGTHIKELPSSAEKMTNLRYLDLSWTFIELLSERIDCFRKLQTLKLIGCSRLRRLPKQTKGLIELRHLYVDVLGRLANFPDGMGALVKLRTLSALPVGTAEGCKITELRNLNNLTGKFCIAKLENVKSVDEAKDASLEDKRDLKQLELRWSDYQFQEERNELDESILENLRPLSDLEEIKILCYPGKTLPGWIADTSFHKLVNITLFRCEHASMLPSLWKLPSLESLKLVGLNSVIEMDCRGKVSDIAFSKLQKLEVDEMLKVEKWTTAQKGDYPCLVELSIQDCPELPELPYLFYLSSLKQLELRGCNKLKFVSEEKLSSSLQQLIVEDCPLINQECSVKGGQDWHKIKHVPNIWMDQQASESNNEDSEVSEEYDDE